MIRRDRLPANLYLAGRGPRRSRLPRNLWPVPFVPTDISGCSLWLPPEPGVIDENLNFWRDLSASGNNATQSTSANRPTRSDWAVDFDGLAQLFDLVLDASVVGAYTVGFALKYDTTAGTTTIFRQGIGANGVHITPAAGNIRQYHRGAGAPNLVSWAGMSTNPATWVFRHDGANNADFQLDGVDQLTQALTNSLAPTNSAALGAWSSASQWADAKIWAVVVYSARLNAAKTAKLTAYLTALRNGNAPPDDWRPNHEPNLVLWLERADIYAGDAVASWEDRSGFGRHVVQAADFRQPSYFPSGGPANMPFVQFDGVSCYLRGTWTQAQPVHTFLVAVPTIVNAASGSVMDGNNGVANSGRLAMDAGPTLLRLIAGATLSTACDADGWHRIGAKLDGATSSVQVDDAAAAAGDAGATDPDGITLAASGVATALADAAISEVVQYNRALSSSEEDRLRSYLVGKYGPSFPYFPDRSPNNNTMGCQNMATTDLLADVPGGQPNGACVFAASFDGATQFCQSGNALSYDFRTQPLSCMTWIRTADSGNKVLIGNLDAGPAFPGWELFVDATGFLVIQFSNDVAAGPPEMIQVRNNDAATWRNGNYHLVGFTYDGSGAAGGVTMYVDGASVAAVVNNNNLVADSSTPGVLAIAYRESTASAHLAADIAQMAVWDDVLSATEVLSVFNAGRPVDLTELDSAANLVGLWEMGDLLAA